MLKFYYISLLSSVSMLMLVPNSYAFDPSYTSTPTSTSTSTSTSGSSLPHAYRNYPYGICYQHNMKEEYILEYCDKISFFTDSDEFYAHYVGTKFNKVNFNRFITAGDKTEIEKYAKNYRGQGRLYWQIPNKHQMAIISNNITPTSGSVLRPFFRDTKFNNKMLGNQIYKDNGILTTLKKTGPKKMTFFVTNDFADGMYVSAKNTITMGKGVDWWPTSTTNSLKFEFVKTPMTWVRANNYCQQKKEHLLTKSDIEVIFNKNKTLNFWHPYYASWTSRLPTPYRAEYFNILRKSGVITGYDIKTDGINVLSTSFFCSKK